MNFFYNIYPEKKNLNYNMNEIRNNFENLTNKILNEQKINNYFKCKKNGLFKP